MAKAGGKKKLHLSTASVHAGEDRRKFADSITNPISQASTFVFRNMKEVNEYAAAKLAGRVTRYEYGRYGNPTETAAASKIAALEGAEESLLSASGMNAATTVLMALLVEGDHLIVTDELYKKTRDFAIGPLAAYGVETTVVKTADYDQLKSAIRKNTKVIFSETPTNPHMWVLDLEKMVKIAHAADGVQLVIDSTFATPINQRPLEFGVDLVIHSATKYLGGHNDLLGGVVSGSQEKIAPIKTMHYMLGGAMAPHCAYLLLRGLKTLALRMRTHNENGMKLAEFLESHPKVKKVFYPGLPSHPQHKIAKSQMDGFGGVVSFDVDGDVNMAYHVMDSVKVPYIGPSLGGVESLIYHPASLTFPDVPVKEREKLGITDQLIRLSCGIEDAETLVEDLKQALDSA